MLAGFISNEEIIQYFKSEYDISLTSAAITYYKNNYEDDIVKARGKLMEKVLSIPIANKFYRIKLRQQLIRNIIDEGLWCEIETKHGSHKKGNHGAVNTILDSVQTEMEPKKFSMTDPSGEKQQSPVLILPEVVVPEEEKRRLKKLREKDAEDGL
jgi:hypothetical protein